MIVKVIFASPRLPYFPRCIQNVFDAVAETDRLSAVQIFVGAFLFHFTTIFVKSNIKLRTGCLPAARTIWARGVARAALFVQTCQERLKNGGQCIIML
jgi:hypothetical protein